MPGVIVAACATLGVTVDAELHAGQEGVHRLDAAQTMEPALKASKLAGETGLAGSDWRVLSLQTLTRSDGAAYGRGRSSTACTTLKMAVLAPIPSASEATVNRANSGARRNWRSATRTSAVSVSNVIEWLL